MKDARGSIQGQEETEEGDKLLAERTNKGGRTDGKAGRISGRYTGSVLHISCCVPGTRDDLMDRPKELASDLLEAKCQADRRQSYCGGRTELGEVEKLFDTHTHPNVHLSC